jgi:hypothetical protein
MIRFRNPLLLLVLTGGVFFAGAVRGEEPPTLEELAKRIEVLTEEVRRSREKSALPETDAELESWYGMGPAASKVYARASGLSLGGYAEFFVQAPTGTDDSARNGDMLRFVPYLGYKFSDRILMNTELEFEHGTTSENGRGEEGSVSVEFCYLDFLLSEAVNARAGSLLLPMGFLNEMHEPPFYWGNARPEIERRIIPSTWRELGAGLHGAFGSRLSYRGYVVNGLDATRFDSRGIREGRQSGNRALFEDVAGVLALRIDPSSSLTVGGAIYAGEADQNQIFDGEEISAMTVVAEGHLEARVRGFRGRALFARSSIEDAAEISAELETTIPERQWGSYGELGFDLASLFLDPALSSAFLWGRFEVYDFQDEVPAGLTKNEALDARSWTVGLDVKPHPNVVLKLDAVIQENEASTPTSDPVRLGAGFIF